MKHILSINDFTRSELFNEIVPGGKGYIQQARARKLDPSTPEKKVTILMIEPTTRTGGSYDEAGRLLGWDRNVIMGKEATSLVKSESYANTARILAGQGADVLVVRSSIEGSQRFMAEILDAEGYCVSVQNAGDGTNQHPTQTFLDLLTISEKLGRFDNLKIGFFGDLKYGRTVHSLLCALSHCKNISLVLVSDPATALPNQYKNLFSDVLESDSLEALHDCDIIGGLRLQEERFEGDPVALQRARGRFCIDQKVLAMLKDDVIIMHPMPYTTEFHPNIIGDPRLICVQQAWYGIPTRMFCLTEGYNNRKNTTGQRGQAGEMQILKSLSLDKYWEERNGRKKSATYFRPISHGTVIDHIPIGFGKRIQPLLTGNYLELNQGVEHLISNKNPNELVLNKEMLVLEGDFPTEQAMINIASLAPSVTFNVIREGMFKKLKIKKPSLITGIGRCPNKNCITNRDPEAKATFVPNGQDIKCHNCENHFYREEII
ncbi:MAG: aspartate carbamoyltransferase regulatory subunit [Patescibacteria group bacterium]